MIFPFRNPVRYRDDMIDCEVEHPEFGWIPFTCYQPEYPELYAQLEEALNEPALD